MSTLYEQISSAPVFMRNPGWRWTVSLSYKASPFQSIAPISSDPWLREAVLFYRHLCVCPDSHLYRQRTYPEMQMAYSLFNGAEPLKAKDRFQGQGGWRPLIESLLLGGLDPEDFSTALKVDMPADAVRLYERVFFSVDEYLESEPAIYINVLSSGDQQLPATTQKKKNSQMETGCIQRLFGYTWGPDALLEQFYSKGRGGNRMYDRWMRNLARNTLTSSVVSQSLDRRNYHREEYLDLLEVAQKMWSIPEEKISGVEQDMKQSFLHEAVTLLDRQLKEADKLIAQREFSRSEALENVFN